MRLRQVGPRDQLWRTRIADIDRGEVLRRAFVGEPQNAAPVLGDLDRHALADPAEPVELVMRQLLEIPNRRVGHPSVSSWLHFPDIENRITLNRRPSRPLGLGRCTELLEADGGRAIEPRRVGSEAISGQTLWPLA